MGVSERSCNLNYISEYEAYIEVWDLLHTCDVAKIHPLDDLIHVHRVALPDI